MKLFNLTVILTALGAMGCGGEDTGPTGNACDHIVGRTFQTPDERDCGAGRPPCKWSVAFDTSTYDYKFQDQAIQRSYECKGLSIVDMNGKSLGKYNPDTDQLTWSGVIYE